MEKSTLGQLQYILPETIFLLKEDLSQLANESRSNSQQLSELQDSNQKKDNDKLSAEVEEVILPDPIKVRGQFEKGILILHEEETLSEEVMEMLVKILQAVGHSMTSVGMLSSVELDGKSLEDFKTINAHTVLKFGRIKHPINSLPIHNYQIHTEEETEYLFADALSIIAEDKELKVKLWTNLKTLFNIA